MRPHPIPSIRRRAGLRLHMPIDNLSDMGNPADVHVDVVAWNGSDIAHQAVVEVDPADPSKRIATWPPSTLDVGTWFIEAEATAAGRVEPVAWGQISVLDTGFDHLLEDG